MRKGAIFSAIFLLMVLPVFGDEGEETSLKRPWTNSAEFSIVQTGGNAESLTLGFKNLYQYRWPKALFTMKAEAIRAKSSLSKRWAIGSDGDFIILEEERVEKTAENYYFNGKYDKKISKSLFWFAGGGWDRNEFAGIKNRYAAFGGLGHLWIDSEKRKFKTDYGLQYAKEIPVFVTEGFDESYVALRLSYNLFQRLFESSKFLQDFEWIINLEEARDFRSRLLSSLLTSLNHDISLKISFDLLYDNRPAFEEVPLFDNLMVQIGTVPFELDELDYALTTAVVIIF